MSHSRLGKIALVAFIVFLIGLIGSAVTVFTGNSSVFSSNKVIEKHHTVALEGAKEVDVEVGMGVGELKLNGGAKDLLEADFNYSKETQVPKVEYVVKNGIGKLEIGQENKASEFFTLNNNTYEWNLNLNNEVPINLEISTGIGESDIELSGLNLRSATIDKGIGETEIDLSGDWEHSFDLQISGGIGEVTVYLPKDVGVKVVAEKGIGEIDANGLIIDGDYYKNDAYETSEITINVELDLGIGEINLLLK